MPATHTTMEQCIRNCQECHAMCSHMFAQVCLEEGGPHLEPHHARIMLDCIDACATCVSFMTRGSDYHELYCQACAEICRVCADSCESVGNMDDCVATCRRCAESCQSMSPARA